MSALSCSRRAAAPVRHGGRGAVSAAGGVPRPAEPSACRCNALQAWLCCSALAVVASAGFGGRRAAARGTGAAVRFAAGGAAVPVFRACRAPSGRSRWGEALTGLSDTMSPGSTANSSPATTPPSRAVCRRAPPAEERYGAVRCCTTSTVTPGGARPECFTCASACSIWARPTLPRGTGTTASRSLVRARHARAIPQRQRAPTSEQPAARQRSTHRAVSFDAVSYTATRALGRLAPSTDGATRPPCRRA